MKPKLFITFLLFCSSALHAQITLDFPKLSGNEVWLYTFSGNKVDSLSVVLDVKGKATVVLLQKEYRGFMYLMIHEKGSGEFIMAEKSLKITCPEEQFHTGMLKFPESAENEFLYEIFQQKAYLLERQEWLQKGEYFLEQKSRRAEKQNNNDYIKPLFSMAHLVADFDFLYDKMLMVNEQDFKQLEDAVKNSSLYAARFFELISYMQRLYNAVQTLDNEQIQRVIEEMQYKTDIPALYHAGTLWSDVHEFYPGLFYGSNSDSVQEAYANSILTTMQRLEEPVLTAFLSSALTVCERTNRPKAQEILFTQFIMRYPTLPVSDTKVQRMLGALSLNKGAQIPEIIGLTNPITQPAILIFFDSDCDHCRDEIDWLIEHYEEFVNKGYRIISIALGTRENNYKHYAATFPWAQTDRLCDFKGTAGMNFKNFGIVGMPMIFVVDEKGVILGKYATFTDVIINNY